MAGTGSRFWLAARQKSAAPAPRRFKFREIHTSSFAVVISPALDGLSAPEVQVEVHKEHPQKQSCVEIAGGQASQAIQTH